MKWKSVCIRPRGRAWIEFLLSCYARRTASPVQEQILLSIGVIRHHEKAKPEVPVRISKQKHTPFSLRGHRTLHFFRSRSVDCGKNQFDFQAVDGNLDGGFIFGTVWPLAAPQLGRLLYFRLGAISTSSHAILVEVIGGDGTEQNVSQSHLVT